MHHIQATAEQKTGAETSLDRLPLLVQRTMGPQWAVETISPVDDQQCQRKEKEIPAVNGKIPSV